jgi:hypothetical protein
VCDQFATKNIVDATVFITSKNYLARASLFEVNIRFFVGILHGGANGRSILIVFLSRQSIGIDNTADASWLIILSSTTISCVKIREPKKYTHKNRLEKSRSPGLKKLRHNKLEKRDG